MIESMDTNEGQPAPTEPRTPVARHGKAIHRRIAAGCSALLAAAAMSVATDLPLLGAVSAEAGCRYSKAQPGTVGTGKAEKAVRCLINRKRGKKGLNALKAKASLAEAAGKHSKRMRNSNCFAHTCSGEPGLGSRLERAGYLPCGCSFGYAETIAWGRQASGTPRSIVMSWMDSSRHRQILLKRSYEHIGVGAVWGAPGDRSAKAGIYTVNVGFKN